MAKSDISKTSSTYSHSIYRLPFHEQPIFHYALALLAIAALIIGAIALARTYQPKNSPAKTTNLSDFLKKLIAHPEMKSYVGTAPLNIVQINNENFANLQSQISGLDVSYIGNYLVQYTDRIIVYDFENDKLRGNVALQRPQQAKLPSDFFSKLNNHTELKGIQNEQPVGGQLDKASLDTLKQQFPDVYANTKVGDFLLRYKTKLIIYDYSNDKIVNSVSLV